MDRSYWLHTINKNVMKSDLFRRQHGDGSYHQLQQAEIQGLNLI